MSHRLAILLTGGGLFVSSVLSATHALGVLPPCGAGSGCELLAFDRRSHYLGQPLAYWGLLGYLLIASALLWGARRSVMSSMRLALPLTGAGLAASGYLTYLSQVVIGASCPWCMASAVTLSILFVVLVLGAIGSPSGEHTVNRRETAVWSSLLVLSMAGGAVLASRQTLGADDIDPRRLQAATIAQLAPADAPSRGDSQGPIVVMFGDFVCPSCRVLLGEMLPLTSEGSGGAVIFRHFPIPAHPTARPLAAMSEVAKEEGRFWQFVEAALSLQPRSDESLRVLAAKAGLPYDALARALDRKDRAQEAVDRDLAFARQLGINGAPRLILVEPNKFPRQVGRAEALAALGP